MTAPITKRKRASDTVSSSMTSSHNPAKSKQKSIGAFFTPSSEKPIEKITWQVRGSKGSKLGTLLVGTYLPSGDQIISDKKRRTKVAAFDFDSTLVQTKSGKVHSTHAHDWKWWHKSVPKKLKTLYSERGFLVAVISNQAGLSLMSESTPKSKLSLFKSKVLEVFSQLDIPITIYAATEKDIYRKPRIGIWSELLKDFNFEESTDGIKLEESIFVGDAAGRLPWGDRVKDFSCCDRDFAENIGIKFATPEEYFLEDIKRPFSRVLEPSDYVEDCKIHVPKIFTKRNECDVVLLCGSPGAGKSSWYWKNLESIDYIRINQDVLKTREKCIKVASQYLSERKSIAVDNTNSDTEVRSKWVELAKKFNVPIRCVYLTTPTEICIHNDVVRALNDSMNPERRTMLPGIAFSGYNKKFQPPSLNEGFQDILKVPFKHNMKFYGSDFEQRIWTRHWA